jgi:Ca-activated chloride channel homolog
MKFSAHLDVDVVAVESTDEVAVLLELAAPPAPADAKERPVSSLQVVLDVSGSMAGPRLEGAKEALVGLVDRLDGRDNFGLVVFDHRAGVVVPAGPLTDKAAVKHRIAQVSSGGSTDLGAGYLRGLQEAARVSGDSKATLLLISDGHANQGVTDPAKLGGVARKGHADGVVTSTLGYGLGYDETLLLALAEQGSGNHHFAEEPDTAGQRIASEVEGLLSKTVTAASLRVEMSQDVSVLRLYNDLPSMQLDDGSVMVELGDFYAEEERKLLLKLGVPAMAALGLCKVATLTLQYVELPGLVQQTITVPVAVNVVPGDEAAGRVPDATVRSEVAFQEAQLKVREASEAMEAGDVGTAEQHFSEAVGLLDSVGPEVPDAVSKDIDAERRNVQELLERSRWDHHSRVSKSSRELSHWNTRKRGRRRPGPDGDNR